MMSVKETGYGIKVLVAPTTHSAEALWPQVPDKSSDILPKYFRRQSGGREDHSLTRSDSDDWGEEARAMKSMPPFWELYLSIKFILTDHQTSR